MKPKWTKNEREEEGKAAKTPEGPNVLKKPSCRGGEGQLSRTESVLCLHGYLWPCRGRWQCYPLPRDITPLLPKWGRTDISASPLQPTLLRSRLLSTPESTPKGGSTLRYVQHLAEREPRCWCETAVVPRSLQSKWTSYERTHPRGPLKAKAQVFWVHAL